MPIKLPRRQPEPIPLRQRPKYYKYKRRVEKFLLASYKLPSISAKQPQLDLPLRFRPCFLALTLLSMILLATLGVHPTLSGKLRVNDKVQHFLGLSVSTGLFYWIFEVEDTGRRVVWWRFFPEMITTFVCFIGGCLVSELIQSLLPYKTFQVGDVIANLLGSTVGLFVARFFARRLRHRRELAQLYQPLDDFPETEEDEEFAVGFQEMEESPTTLLRDPVASTRLKKSRADDPWNVPDSASVFSLGDEEDEVTQAQMQ